MRTTTAAVCLAFVCGSAAALSAGPIYGTIVADGQGLKGVTIEIVCGKDAPIAATAAADGAYRINVPQEGQCTLALPSYQGRPSAVIFSSPNPTLYNFEVVKLADGKFELKRK